MFPARMRHGDETAIRVGDSIRVGNTRAFASVVAGELRADGFWYRLLLGPVDLGWLPEARVETF